MRACLAALLPVALSTTLGLAQSASEPPKFEVAEIKLNNSTTAPSGSGDLERGGQVRFSGVSLRQMMVAAWQVKEYAIVGGPRWIDTDHFEVVVKAAPQTSPQDFGSMLRALLIERFQLTFHNGEKIMPVFALVVDKPNASLVPSTAEMKDGTGCSGRRQAGLAQRICKNTSMNLFAMQLAQMSPNYIDRPVVDQTGLSGRYDFKLFWEPAQLQTPDKLDKGPTIFEAVKSQLGLKLESTKLPVQTVVIDKVERLQSDN